MLFHIFSCGFGSIASNKSPFFSLPGNRVVDLALNQSQILEPIFRLPSVAACFQKCMTNLQPCITKKKIQHRYKVDPLPAITRAISTGIGQFIGAITLSIATSTNDQNFGGLQVSLGWSSLLEKLYPRSSHSKPDRKKMIPRRRECQVGSIPCYQKKCSQFFFRRATRMGEGFGKVREKKCS